jgi:hypothetical protein
MAALWEWNVTAGAVRRVVRGVAVVGGHGVPEVLEGRRYSVSQSVSGSQPRPCRGAPYCWAMAQRGSARRPVQSLGCAGPSGSERARQVQWWCGGAVVEEEEEESGPGVALGRCMDV